MKKVAQKFAHIKYCSYLCSVIKKTTQTTDRRADKVIENMAIFRIVEFNNAGRENNYRDFQSYEECYKAFKKQRKKWEKFAEEAARIQTVIKEYTPFCYSLYQNGEIRLTWEIVVIPTNKFE